MDSTVYDYLWFFVIYAFLGWCVEVVYEAVDTGKFVNRGFLNGPVCPIYGFGVVLVVTLLTPLKENILLLFIGSVLLTSVLEWLTGWTLEKVFAHRWWDYSHLPFNLNGYICLKFSLMWGIACVFVINILHPLIQNFVLFIDVRLSQVLLGGVYAMLAADSMATVQSILKLNRQLQVINEIGAKIREVSDIIGEELSSDSIALLNKTRGLKNEVYEEVQEIEADVAAYFDQLKERRNKIMEPPCSGAKRLLQAFPGMKSNKYNKELEELRKKICER